MDKKMGTKLINISRGTQKNKEKINKDNFIYNNSSKNKENIIIFPNIDNYIKFNDINNDSKLRNTHINNRGKKIKYSKFDEIFKKNYNSVDKIKKQYTITEFDTPKIEEKYLELDKKYLSTSFKNKNNNTYYTFNSIDHDFFIENIKNNKLSSFSKTNKLNNNNISNINNIFNKKDYLKNTYSNMNNSIKRKNIMTIKNLKNSDTDIISKENNYENNTILNLLYKKSMKVINQRNNKRNKTQRRDEFKDFLQEVLRQYRTKNVIKVKKKVDINCLLKNLKNYNNPKVNKLNNNENNLNELNNNNTNKNSNQSDYNVLRNGNLESKFNKINLKNNGKNKIKKNYFNIYRFKKNKRLINEVEEKLSNLEDKIRENFDNFKNNIDNEIVNYS
jgi:hypothetical protein